MKFFLKRTTFLLAYMLIMSVYAQKELIKENQIINSKLYCEILNAIDEYLQIIKLENGMFGIETLDSTHQISINSTNQIQDYNDVLIIQNEKEIDINVYFNFADYQIKSNYIGGLLYKQVKFNIDTENQIYFNVITFSQTQFKEFIFKDFGKISLRQKSDDLKSIFLSIIFITIQNIELQIDSIIGNFNSLNKICEINECKADLKLQTLIENIDILQMYPINILKAQYSKNKFLQDFNLLNYIFYADVLSENDILQQIKTNSCSLIMQDQILINNSTYLWHHEFCNNSQSYIYIIQTKKSYDLKKWQNYIFSFESEQKYQPETLINKITILIQKSNCKSLERIKKLLKINGILLQQESVSIESQSTYSKYQASINTRVEQKDSNLIIEPIQNFLIKDNSENESNNIPTFQLSQNLDQKPIYKTLNGVYTPQDPELFLMGDDQQNQKEINNDINEETITQQSEQKKQSLLQKEDENEQNLDFIVYEDPISWVNQDSQDVEVFEFNEDQQTINNQIPIQSRQKDEIKNSDQKQLILQNNVNNQQTSNQILQLQQTSSLNQINQQDGMIIEQQTKVEEIILDDQDNSQAQNFNGQQQQQQQQQVFTTQYNQQDNHIHQGNIGSNQKQDNIQENESYKHNRKQYEQPDDYDYTSLYSDYDSEYDFHPRRHLTHYHRTPKTKQFHHHHHKISKKGREYENQNSNLSSQGYSGQKFNLRGNRKNYDYESSQDDTIPIIADRIIIEYNFVNKQEEDIKLHGDEDEGKPKKGQEDEEEPKKDKPNKSKSNKNKEEAEDDPKEEENQGEEQQQKANKSQNSAKNKPQNKSQDKNKEDPKNKAQDKSQSKAKDKEKQNDKPKPKPKPKSNADEEGEEKEQDQGEQQNEDQENQEEEKNEEKENEDEQGQDQEKENNEEKENAEEKENGEEKGEDQGEEKGEEMDEDDQWRGFSSKDKNKKKGKSRGNGNKEDGEEEDEELYDGDGRYIRNHPYYQHRKNKKSHYPYNYPGRYPGDELFDEDLLWSYRCMNRQNRFQNFGNPFSGYPYRHRQVVNSNPFYNGNPYQRLNPYTKQSSSTSCVPWMVRQSYPPYPGYGRYSNLYRGKYQDPDYQLRDMGLRQEQQQHSKQQVQRYRDQVGYFNCYGNDDMTPTYYEAYQGIIEDDPRYQVFNRNINDPNVFSPFDETVHYGHNYVSEKHLNAKQGSKPLNHRMVQQKVDLEQQENNSCLQVFDQCYFKGRSVNLCGEYPVIPQGLNGFKIFSYIVPDNLEIRFSQSDQNEDNVSDISGSEECLQIPYELIPQQQ